MPVTEQVPQGDALATLIDSLGGEECVRSIEADLTAAWTYLDASHDVLTARYPDEWVALHRDQVVAHAFDARDLARELDSAGIDRRRVVVHQMTTKERTFLL